MSSNFQHYRAAALDVSRGWLRGDFKNNSGDKCLVQGVLNAAGIKGQYLPPEMVNEIDNQLKHYWSYRLMRKALTDRGHSVQDAIMLWNDMMWRRKHQVVEVLNELADGLELEWLRDERLRLTHEVSELRNKVRELEEKVHSLEEERNFLRKLTNASTLRADREQLQDLSDELDEKWEQLKELPMSLV